MSCVLVRVQFTHIFMSSKACFRTDMPPFIFASQSVTVETPIMKRFEPHNDPIGNSFPILEILGILTERGNVPS